MYYIDLWLAVIPKAWYICVWDPFVDTFDIFESLILIDVYVINLL